MPCPVAIAGEQVCTGQNLMLARIGGSGGEPLLVAANRLVGLPRRRNGGDQLPAQLVIPRVGLDGPLMAVLKLVEGGPFGCAGAELAALKVAGEERLQDRRVQAVIGGPQEVIHRIAAARFDVRSPATPQARAAICDAEADSTTHVLARPRRQQSP